MAFGGLIGKETQVDLSQYVTETELNSKGFATQSWVTQQLPNLPEGFGEIVDVPNGSTIEVDSSGIYLVCGYYDGSSGFFMAPSIFYPGALNRNQAIQMYLYYGTDDYESISVWAPSGNLRFSWNNKTVKIFLLRLR